MFKRGEDSNMGKAQVLIQALPYIQKYNGKTIVVKYGGNAMINEQLQRDVINDIVLLSCVGIKVVVVHGGGPAINETLKKIGKKSEFIDGLRVTDEETIDIVQMVLAGKVNKDIAALIVKSGGNAIGLCGLDANLLKAKKLLKEGKDIGFVGEIVDVNEKVIEDCLASGYIPVISTVALNEEDGKTYNINADYAAAKIAVKLKAEKLMLLTDVPGILSDINDLKSLISVVNVEEVPSLINNKIISRGMIPKVECCVESVNGGVKRTHIIDGRIPHSILLEIFSDMGVGTMIE
ncbi:acetylglutamate kinase [Clostridium grantii]|uniref:Acetylglutamate kinase n=1 Tax=Clostridium grantii DSM 8605 TaxID=1121316 RepID=A0A1M5XZT5_9CLOT|nr:acetylglutamate kinase [Clostridium grantii]SHI05310.1 N-acetylglutamate kinase [Clostridium grantii DSM 8605]